MSAAAEGEIDEDLVTALVAAQVPDLAGSPVRAVERQGWDNRTFRVGEQFSARLPSADGYVSGIVKEDQALPLLTGRLPVAVPEVVASLPASTAFPRPWTLRRWIDGVTLDGAGYVDRTRFATDLGLTLKALREVSPDGGHWAGGHTHYRGCHPSVYADQVQTEMSDQQHGAIRTAALAVWETGMRSAWTGAPVWFHGDVAVGNLLLTDGRLSALIDFGQCGLGDPACDLAVAWTMFDSDQRRAFRDAVALDEQTWQRGRAWALWKALVTVRDPQSALFQTYAEALPEIIADPVFHD